MKKMILYSALGTLFCFLMTTLGSALVFLGKEGHKKKMQSFMIGTSAGVMLAASFFSLILPSLQNEFLSPTMSFLYTLAGLVLGYLFLTLLDVFFPGNLDENLQQKKNRFLFLSITLHNIPEGMVVGLSIALSFLSSSTVTFIGAMMLALGVGIQNFPEGSAVSFPYYHAGNSKKKSFLMGMLSGIVEPIFGILVVFIAYPMAKIMPLFLSFAAGTMIYVVINELIMEAKEGEGKFSFGSLGFMLGFLLMMSLDVLLG